MGIKTYSPYTPSRRHMTGSDFSEITTSTPEKSLVVSLKKNAGRNNQGKITVRHRGGGNRTKYRIVDFKRRKDDIPATVKTIEYDPNRTANIALIAYADGEKAYILAPEGLKVGMKIMNGENAEVRPGNCLPLANIPVGTMVHNSELYPGKGGQRRRASEPFGGPEDRLRLWRNGGLAGDLRPDRRHHRGPGRFFSRMKDRGTGFGQEKHELKGV